MAERFHPRTHFVFKGQVYYRSSAHAGLLACHGVKAPVLGEEPEGPLKMIHVNRHHIAKNRKDGGNRPVYTVKVQGKKAPVYARSVIIDGPSECVADDGQLSCGARVWIETNALLHYFDPMTYEEAKQAFDDAVLEGEG